MQITSGEVMPIYSDREFDHVLKMHGDQLTIVCASSTDCVPCRAFEPVFQVSLPSYLQLYSVMLCLTICHIAKIIFSHVVFDSLSHS